MSDFLDWHENFDVDIPEFRPPSVESNVRAFNRVLPKSMQALIAEAAMLAHWKNDSGAAKVRARAGYR